MAHFILCKQFWSRSHLWIDHAKVVVITSNGWLIEAEIVVGAGFQRNLSRSNNFVNLRSVITRIDRIDVTKLVYCLLFSSFSSLLKSIDPCARFNWFYFFGSLPSETKVLKLLAFFFESNLCLQHSLDQLWFIWNFEFNFVFGIYDFAYY